MGNELKGLSAHSSEYFGDTRDHWWHDDFIAMVGRHWRLEGVRKILDVGCGVGHWTRILARIVPREAHLIGVDREKLWVEKATERAAAAGLSERLTYRIGSAESLLFEDGAFDVVTCQTLLMHVDDPLAVLAEMVRVTRPGGLVIAAEPTNLAGPLVGSIVLGDSPEVTAALIYFQLVCERGKKNLGEGDNLIGESLPLLFRRVGLKKFEIRQNDRAWHMLSPYESQLQQAQIEEVFDGLERNMWIWNEATTRQYFLSGGGKDLEFRECWSAAMAQRRRMAEAIRDGTYSCAGGGFFYLAWGYREAE